MSAEPGEQGAGRAEVDDVVRSAEGGGELAGVVELLGVALPVVERQQPQAPALGP